MAIERVGVSFESDLLEKFDILIQEKGYPSRSEAIRDLVRRSLIESKIEDEHDEIIGTLTIIYDHDIGDVTNRLLHLQHHHHSEVLSTMHIHINEKICLEVLIVRGENCNVRKLGDAIKAIKGVIHGEMVTTKASF